MRASFPFLFCAVLATLGVSAASAQQHHCAGARLGMGGPPPLMLLAQKSVQDDLKLSEEQVKQVSESKKKQMEAFHQLKELSREEREKKIPELRKEQKKIIAGI